MNHIQLAEGRKQLAVNVVAGLAHDVVSRADDDQLAGDQRGFLLHAAERGTDDALGAIARNGTAQLLGNGKTDAVRPFFQRMGQHSFFGGVIGENVYGDKLADITVATAKYLIVKMVFLDC